MKAYRSISVQIMLAVLLTVVSVLAVSSIIELNVLKQRETQRLQEKGSLTADRVANSLAYTLWNLSPEETEEVVLDEMGSTDIYRIQVFDEDGSLYVGKVRGADGTVKNIDAANPGALATSNATLYSFSKEINFKNTRIGSVTLDVTDANLQAELASERREIAIKMLLLVAVLSVVLLLALRALVIRPISTLKSWVANIPSGNGAQPPRFKLSGEINSLAEAFSKMSVKLREKNAELEAEHQRLQELNTQMQAEIEERKRTEQALRSSEERFVKIFNLSPVRMGIIRLRDRVVLQVNDTWEREMGYSREEMINRPILELSDWMNSETMERVKRWLESGKPTHGLEGLMKTKTGEERYVMTSTEVIELDGEPCFIWASSDITERKRAEEALQASERRFSIAFNSSPVPATITTYGDWRFLAVNDQFVSLTGYSRDEAIGHDALELDMLPDLEKRAEAHAIIAREGRVQGFEAPLRMKNKEERIMLFSMEKIELEGQPCLLQTGIDITERKRAEEELRESESRFRAIFENSGSGMALVDLQGHPIECNPTFQKILGYTEEEMKGMSFIEFTHPDDRELNWELYGELMASKRDKYEIEKRYITKDGRIIWAIVITTLIRDKDGLPRYAVGMMQDITERKLAEEKLRWSEERFAKAFHASPEPITIFRHRDGILLEVNERWQDVYGYTREEAIGQTSLESTTLRPEDRERLRGLLEKQHSIRDFEIDLKTKQGEVRHISLSAEQIVINDEVCDIFLHRDITDRRRAEEQNRRLIHDMGERVKELTALHKTARILQNEKKSVADLLGEIVSLLPPAWQYPEVTAARISFGEMEFKTENFSPTRWSQTAEFTASDSKGMIEVVYLEERPQEAIGPFLMEERNLIDSLAEMISSTLNRRFAQEALRASEERFAKAFQACPLPISIYRHRDGILLEVNERWLHVYGYTREEALGHTAIEVGLVEPEVRQRIANLLEEQGSIRDLEVDFQTKYGAVRHVSLSAEPIVIAGERCNIFLQYDITERMEAEEELRTSREQLRALSESLRRAKEEEGIRIARELHDELGAALTSLKWSLMRLDKVYSADMNTAGNGNAHAKIEEMVGLVDATINTVRRISSELRPGVLDDLGLIPAIEWHAHQFQANTGILCRFDSLIENIDLSREQATTVFRIFQEAMTNILRHARATKVNILIEEEEDEFVLEVSDNGRGITESEKLGIRSLGLLGMRERAHSISGKVEINGTQGKGTTLIVRLPLHVNSTV